MHRAWLTLAAGLSGLLLAGIMEAGRKKVRRMKALAMRA